MSKIVEVKNAVVEFLKENIHCHDITIIKLNKESDIWEAIAEVYEDDSFLKSMNLPPKNTRVFYSIKIDLELEVTAYERMTEYSQ